MMRRIVPVKDIERIAGVPAALLSEPTARRVRKQTPCGRRSDNPKSINGPKVVTGKVIIHL